MLRRGKVLNLRFSMFGRAALAGLTICAIVLAADWRSPFVEVALAQVPDDTLPSPTINHTTPVALVKLQKKTEPLSLAYVPRDSAMVLAARPSTILAKPVFAKIKDAIDGEDGLQEMFGVDVRNIEQVTIAFLPEERPGMPGDPAVILRYTDELDPQGLLKQWLRRWDEDEIGGQKYYRGTQRRSCLAFLDAHTLIAAEKPADLIRVIAAGKRGAANANWNSDWNRVADSQAAVMIDLERLRAGINQEFRRGPQAALINSLSPVWEDGQRLVFGANAADTLALQLFLACEDGAADRVKDTIRATLVLARNGLSALRANVAQRGGTEALMVIKGADLADEVIDETKIELKGDVVLVSVTVGEETADIVTLLVPAIKNARIAAKRSQSMNNMKMIGLAMHNYHDAYRHFPTAVVMGPDGKTPHSWRVEILPFLDQAPLYNEYRMNEPWDSEHNKKLLEKIPDVLRSPMDDSLSTETSYFALTGQNTIFDKNVKRGDAVGVAFRDITDGTSNTLMVVESKQAVPWTKPDDIPIDFDKELPEFGGWYDDGFIGLICDGSVRFFLKTLDKDTLQKLITRNGGEVIPNY